MRAHPDGGCYGLCYANRTATRIGIDFSVSVSRRITSFTQGRNLTLTVRDHPGTWFRIGTMGDPCHDWPWTITLAEMLSRFKTPILITKHWVPLGDGEIDALRRMRAVVNTSTSPLDSRDEREYRIDQHLRLIDGGVRAVLRVVSCRFGRTDQGREWDEIQDGLFRLGPFIDNPLRIPASDPRVRRGDILVERRDDLGGGSSVSVARREAYVGTCDGCPDQCGVTLV